MRWEASVRRRVETREEDAMTRVLVAAASADEGVRVAAASLELFGHDADYTVLNVATSGSGGMSWGDDELTWGASYPLVLPPMGGVAGGPPLVIRRDAEFARPADTAFDVAHEVAAEVATAAELPHARPLGDVGDPAEAILAAVRHSRSDVVVVGSHDRSWFSRLVNPSVTNAVVDGAGIPVLVVPAVATE
jgi:nucleotide-binding universal stress UspA family protein